MRLFRSGRKLMSVTTWHPGEQQELRLDYGLRFKPRLDCWAVLYALGVSVSDNMTEHASTLNNRNHIDDLCRRSLPTL